jgi:hypothetical protein
MKATPEELRSAIADRLVEIEAMFRPRRQRYVTCIVRSPGNPEDEVIVSNDPDDEEVIATLRRRASIQSNPDATAEGDPVPRFSPPRAAAEEA